MGLFDIFKKKKRIERPEKPKKPMEKPAEKPIEMPKKKEIEQAKKQKPKVKIAPEPKKKSVPTKSPAAKKTKEISEMAYKILRGPHVTEKATDLAAKNQYIFKIFPRANKIEVKKAIQQAFGTKVLKVRIINVPRKPKRFGKATGWKKGYKKAIITIKQGEKINILSS